MNDLDHSILDAWNRLAPRLRADRTRALRRLTPTLSRPIRPWCLCLRASDTRLDYYAAISDPPDPDAPPAAQLIELDADAIAALVRPITLPWPGIDWTHAAARLGRHPEAIRPWLDRGILTTTRYNARSVGKIGHPVPHVWAPAPLDPNANHGAPPDPLWGTLWQYHHTNVPHTATLAALRIPRTRPDPRGSRRPDDTRARGWNFLCPGLPRNAAAADSPCGRTVARLYIPLRIWSLADALGDDPLSDITLRPPSPRAVSAERRECQAEGLLPPALSTRHSALPGGEGQREGLLPPSPRGSARGEGRGEGPTPSTSPYSFPPPTPTAACHHCHRIRYFSLNDRNAWNLFITHITAGLLYGHEVPRPNTITATRKRAYTPHRRNNPADETIRGLPHTPRQAQVLRAILAGATSKQIASTLGIGYETVVSHINRLYKLHAVRTRPQLRAKFPLPLRTRLASQWRQRPAARAAA